MVILLVDALTWPDLEASVAAHLTARLPAPVYTETPPDASLPVPRVVVERVGGAGLGIVQDVDIEVTVWAATRAAMWALVSLTETAMGALAAAGQPYVDDVALPFAFAAQPPRSHGSRSATATYTLTVRPQA